MSYHRLSQSFVRDVDFATTASTENENGNRPRQPCVDIDDNQVGMRLLKKGEGAVHNIIGIASLLAKFGLDVCMIADNGKWERASVERAAKREQDMILGLQAREELAMLLWNENPPKEKIEELRKTIQSKERAAYKTLPEILSSRYVSVLTFYKLSATYLEMLHLL